MAWPCPPAAFRLNLSSLVLFSFVQLMAQEAGLHVDMAGFQAAMEEAKELSRAGESLF